MAQNKDFRVKNGLVIGAGSDNEQTFPTTRGSTGQVLRTDESGNLSWQTFSTSISTSDTAPTNPTDGTLWWDSTVGSLFIYVDDGQSSQWVETVVPPIAIGYESFSVNTGAPVSSGSLTYDNTNGEYTYSPPDLSSYLTSETTTSLTFSANTLTYTDETGTANNINLSAYANGETLTSLSLTDNTLSYIDENGTTNNIDLSVYLDDTTNTILSAALVGNTVTFTREDDTTFTLDVSNLYDDTNIVTSVAGRTGAVTLTKADITDFNDADYEPADTTILKDADIGVNVQAYDANAVSDASYVHIDVTNNSVTDGTNTFTQYNDTALAGRVTTLENAGYLTAETTTSLSFAGDTLSYTDETGTTTNIDLSAYLDEDARSIASGTLNSTTGIVTFTRDDASTFILDLSGLLDDTNLVTSVAGKTGVVTLTKADITDFSDADYEPADVTILKDADIGVTVQAYDANTVSDASYSHITVTSNSVSDGINTFTKFDGQYSSLSGAPVVVSAFTNDAGYLTSYTETDPIFNASPAAGISATNIVNWNTAYGWGDHSTAGYLTSYTETNDLTSAVTWTNVPDVNITETSVTQHEGALTITESQISDLQSYLTSETTTTLTFSGSTLTYTDETGTVNNLDLSSFLDEDSRSIASGVLNTTTGIVTFTRDNNSTFTLDLSGLLDDTNLVTSVAGKTGVVTLTKADITDFSDGDYEPADSTILKDADIGVTIQAYDADAVSDANYAHITVSSTSVSDGTTTFNQYNDAALSTRVTNLESAGYLTTVALGDNSDVVLGSPVNNHFLQYNGTNWVNGLINYSQLEGTPTALSSFTDDVGYLTNYTETDPIFNASPAAGITTTHISSWNTAHAWGDHSSAGYLTAETTTSLSLVSNTLSFTDETGTTTNIDLSAYLDEDARAISSGTLNSTTGIVTFTRDDTSTFTLDLSALLDDTNLVTSVAGKAGVVTLVKADITDFSDADYATAAQGVLADSAIQSGDNISTLTNDAGYITSYTNTTDVAISDDTTSTSTFYPTFTSATTGTIDSESVSTTKLYFQPSTGTLSATELNTLSDANLKDNIVPLENSIDVLRKINPVSFEWKESGEKAYGVIAQELEQVLPDLVRTNDVGTKSVAYNQLIAFLINTVNEQQDKINDQEALLSNVLDRLYKLENGN